MIIELSEEVNIKWFINNFEKRNHRDKSQT